MLIVLESARASRAPFPTRGHIVGRYPRQT